MYLITNQISRSRVGPDLVFPRIEIRLSPFICDVVNHVCSRRFATLRTDRPLSPSVCARDPMFWTEAYYLELETCSVYLIPVVYMYTVYLLLLPDKNIFSVTIQKISQNTPRYQSYSNPVISALLLLIFTTRKFNNNGVIHSVGGIFRHFFVVLGHADSWRSRHNVLTAGNFT